MVSLPAAATQVVAGANHSVVLLEDGRVFAWGSNEFGQVGCAPRTTGMHEHEDNEKKARGADEKEKENAAVEAVEAVAAVEAEERYTLPQQVRLKEGRRKENGGSMYKPILVKAVGVSAGYAHTVLHMADGQVLVFGQNESGQLGLGEGTAGCAGGVGEGVGEDPEDVCIPTVSPLPSVPPLPPLPSSLILEAENLLP